jgi:hypothetical protein
VSSLRAKSPSSTILDRRASEASKSLTSVAKSNASSRKRELDIHDLDSSNGSDFMNDDNQQPSNQVKRTTYLDSSDDFNNQSEESDTEMHAPPYRERATFGTSLRSGYSVRIHSDDGRGDDMDPSSTLRLRQEEQKRFEEREASRKTKEENITSNDSLDFSDFSADSPYHKKEAQFKERDLDSSEVFDEENARLLKTRRKEQEEEDKVQQQLLSSLRQKVDQLSQSCTQLRGENQELRMTHSTTSVRLERLLAQNRELEERMKDDEIQTAKLRELNKSLETKILQEDVNSLLMKQENSRLRDSQLDVQRVDEDRKRLEDELRQLREQNPQLQTRVNRLQDRNKELEEDIAKVKQHSQTKINVVDQENTNLRKEIREHTDKIHLLTSKVENIEHDNAQLEWSNNQLKKELEQLRSDNVQAQKELLQIRRENERLQVHKQIGESRNEIKQIMETKEHVELNQQDETIQAVRTITPTERKELQSLKQELKDQDQLFKATQDDNKRLLEELKTVRKQLKEQQENLVNASNRQQLSMQHQQQDDGKTRELQSRVMDLEKRLHHQTQTALEHEMELKQELQRAREAKKRLEAEYAGANLKEIEREAYMIQDLENRLKSMEMKHQLQVQDLNNKLRWYMENQKMIDENDAEIRNLRSTIKMLEQKIDDLMHTPQSQQSQQAGPSQAVWRKRVRDLEKQIEEMRRHEKDPNTITQLIRAVKGTDEINISREEDAHMKILERKVELLESELQETSENATKNLRVLKQETDRLKLHYEKQIEELQTELSKYMVEEPSKNAKVKNPPMSKVKELQKQLDETRVFYRKKIAELEEKLKSKPNTVQAKLTRNDRNEEDDGKVQNKKNQEVEEKYKQKATKLESELEYRNDQIKRLEQQLQILQQVQVQPKPGTTTGTNDTEVQQQLMLQVFSVEQLKRENEQMKREGEQNRRDFDQSRRETEQYRHQNDMLLQQRSQWMVERPVQKVDEPSVSVQEHNRIIRELEECKMKLEVASMAKTTIMSHAEEMIRAAQAEVQQMRILNENETKQFRNHQESERREFMDRHERELRWHREQLEQYKQQLIDAQQAYRQQLHEVEQKVQTPNKTPSKRLVVDADRVEFAAITSDDRIRQLRFLESRLQDIESSHKLKEMEFNRIIHETKHRADMDMSMAKQQFEFTLQEKNREVQKFKLQLQNIMSQLAIIKQNRHHVVPVLHRTTATTTTVPFDYGKHGGNPSKQDEQVVHNPNENDARLFEKRNQDLISNANPFLASPPPKPRTAQPAPSSLGYVK